MHVIRAINPAGRVLVTSGHSDDYQGVVDGETVALSALGGALRSGLAAQS